MFSSLWVRLGIDLHLDEFKSLGLLVFVTSRSIWTSGFSLKYFSISGLLRSFFPQGAIM